MARKQKKKESSGSPAWMTTFSDLMTLLLTFFVLLFSMSNVSADRFKEAADSLKLALIGSGSDSILEGDGTTLQNLDYEEFGSSAEFDGLEPEELVVSDSPVNPENVIPKEVHELYETVSTFLDKESIQTDVSISRDHEGVYIDIQETILFDSAKAELKENGKDALGTLSGLFDLFDNELIIEGYTDNVPISTEVFPSNWELSVARAVSVIRYLTEEHGISPQRLSARGFGEHRPLVPNDSKENRALNRRVNIVIVHNDREEVKNGSGN